MNTDPFADLPLDPEVLRAANVVRDRMSLWIDAQVRDLKARMSEAATLKAQNVAAEAQRELNDILVHADKELETIVQNLREITVKFTDPGLKEQGQRLEQAIKAHHDSIAAQGAKIQQYGQLMGSVIRKAMMAV